MGGAQDVPLQLFQQLAHAPAELGAVETPAFKINTHLELVGDGHGSHQPPAQVGQDVGVQGASGARPAIDQPVLDAGVFQGVPEEAETRPLSILAAGGFQPGLAFGKAMTQQVQSAAFEH